MQVQSLMSADQLAALPDDGRLYELVKGVLRTMPLAGGRHGRITGTLCWLLHRHVLERRLGTVFSADTGFILARNPDTVRAPDVAFISKSRSRPLDEEVGFVDRVPDLVGEVVSPSDSYSAVNEKALAWLAAGVRMVLVVDPETRTLHVYRSVSEIAVQDEDAVLDAGDVVPGWTLRVADLFAE